MKPKKRYWYIQYTGECQACGRDLSYRVRQRTTRPSLPSERNKKLLPSQRYCGCRPRDLRIQSSAEILNEVMAEKLDSVQSRLDISIRALDEIKILNYKWSLKQPGLMEAGRIAEHALVEIRGLNADA